uniref:CSON010445 protein n=1 Tax=Culicoides sonorensis TaxID=179676 RepID=A0A336LRM6_CULSO
MGWIWAFYIPAIITAVVSFIWLYIASDSPESHPRISDSERMYIQKSQEGQVMTKKPFMPVKHVLTSIPFWALIILHFGNNWGLYFLLTAAPKFMNEVLGFDLTKAGFLAALPYLARLLSGFTFGSIGDYVRTKKVMSVTMMRKFFTIFSHIIPGILLIGLCFVQGYPYVAVALVTLSLGFNGSATLTNLQNSQDLSPNFAGSLYGIVNFFGTTTGFLSPMVVAHFTHESNTFDEWRQVFLIAGSVYIVPAIIFMIFGSGQVQSWNDFSDKPNNEKDKEIKERYISKYPAPIQGCFDKVPARFNVGIMLFMACFIAYMVRVNISVNILAMVMPDNKTGNATDPPDYGPRYEWDGHAQGLILGAYFWGYLTTSLFGGTLSEWFGGRCVIFWSFMFAAVFTFLSPLLASYSFWCLFGIRYLIGFVGGVLYPALHNLVSRWAPPEEKGKFIASLLGGNFGTVVTWAIVGVIIETLGWIWAFYIPAIFIIFMSFLWLYLVADRPGTHPRISEKEKQFIEDSLGQTVSTEKRLVPFFKILTSIPFWALLLLHYGNLWGLYFLLTASPKYMSEVLKFKLSNAGFLSALPHLARVIFGLGFGEAGDYLRRNNIVSVTTIRKSFTLFSHIIPACFLIGMGFVENPYISVALMTLSLGFNGASTMTSLQNSQDLAPNFAGTLYGIINFTGTTTGFITPLLVAHFTKDNNTMNEWRKIFFVGSGIYISTAIIFIIFGTATIQSWNDIEPKKKKSEDTRV